MLSWHSKFLITSFSRVSDTAAEPSFIPSLSLIIKTIENSLSATNRSKISGRNLILKSSSFKIERTDLQKEKVFGIVTSTF